ncbi:MAG TPA: GNAT family N-acetyltransferase [bacterium]|nr:GNAT family N-acetyltransferase [bacterium]
MSATRTPAHPPQWHKDVILKDGTPLRLRPITPEDGDRLQRLHGRLSTQSIYTRFMSLMPRLTAEQVRRFTVLDYDDEMAIVGVLAEETEPGGERLIAVGRYVRLPKPTHAEVAFTVEDRYQGRGIATHLLQELLPFARLAEIEVLEAEVLAENRPMLEVFNHMGFQLTASLQEGVVHVEFPVTETALTQERRWAREQATNITMTERIFRPRSVAVVGASNTRHTIGNTLVRNLLAQEFVGPVYPVNPAHKVVCSMPCYPSLQEVPDVPDLVVVAVPQQQVLEVVRQCAAKHVYALVIISAGFGETGAAGQALQQELTDLVRRHGMRLVGPNCLGLLNTDPAVRLNATFAPVFPPAGRVALSSQSGALAIAILNLARELRLGISQFVSVGNKADISSNDLLHFWASDPGTDVILLYMESFGNPKKFSRIARQVSAKKPIVVLKSGTSRAGARAANSHTGALASSALVDQTLMEQAGIIQTDSMERFFHAAKVLSTQPLPEGNRLAILTNAGGPGILSADRAEAEGLAVPALSPELQAQLHACLLPSASAQNPVDMIAQASAQHYEAALTLLLASPEVDQVAVLFIPPMVTEDTQVAQAILNAQGAVPQRKPLVACMMGEQAVGPAFDLLEQARIPTFRFPEEAVTALAHLTRYRNWRTAPRGERVVFADARKAQGQQLLKAATQGVAAQGAWLEPLDGHALLQAYGIPAVPTLLAQSAEQAAQCARQVGLPVALKLASRTIQHKSDVQGVQLRLRTEEEVRQAYAGMQERLRQAGMAEQMQGALIQPMASAGLEMVLGMTQDPNFGPVLMVGLGGIYLELFRDVQFALQPLTDRDAELMLERLHSRRILDGYRGEPARDVTALKEALLRLSQLVEDHPQIQEADLNPILVRAQGQGCQVLDWRFRVAPVDPFQEFVISHLED